MRTSGLENQLRHIADLQVVHIGTGLQKTVGGSEGISYWVREYLLDRHIEQIKPTSMIFLWQKHAARKSTLSSVGTAIRRRKPEGGRKQVYRIVREGPSECNGENVRISTAREPHEF